MVSDLPKQRKSTELTKARKKKMCETKTFDIIHFFKETVQKESISK